VIQTTIRLHRRAGALALGLLAAQATPALAAGVRLDPAAQQHLGVAVAKPAAANHAGETDAFAKVLDPGPLVQLVSDLKTAEAAAVASSAEAVRAKALNTPAGGVSSKDAQAAVAQARADALKVAFLRRRVGVEWGPGVARMSPARLDRLLAGLERGSTALVHVDSHNNEGQAGARFVKIDIGDASVRGAVIGPARVAEPRLQSSGLIVEVDGPQAILLSVGLTQSAHIESSAPQAGVILPRAALIRYRGSQWVYVRTGASTFERRLAPNPVPQADGFFVASGFSQNDEVVDRGAAALFAAEQSAPVESR
jgi:hypothetical protein